MKRLFGVLTAGCLLAVGAIAAETPKMGDAAPALEAKDQNGNTWKLAEHLRKESVVVYFYPKDNTSECTKEAIGFRDQLNDFKKAGVTVVGVSRDDAATHKDFCDKNNLNFPLLVDTDGKLTEAFGAGAAGRPRARRVSFLIGCDGKILDVIDSRDAALHLSELKDAVAKLKS